AEGRGKCGRRDDRTAAQEARPEKNRVGRLRSEDSHIIAAMPRRVRSVVRNVLRKEGVDKVTGAARYIDDLTFPGLLHGRTIRSTIAAGRIVAVRPQLNTPGFTIVDSTDIPGRNVVALIDDDQPSLAEREIRHVAEPIVLLAHADREALLAAEGHVDYETATPHYDPETSATTFNSITIEKRNLDAG